MGYNSKPQLFSENSIDGYVSVLQRIGLADEDELTELLSLFSKGFNILFTTKTPKLEIVKENPDDDKFVECAIALKAEYIITRDKAILSLGQYMNIKILSPSEFIRHWHKS